MTSRLMLLAGAAALVFASASAEPPHGPKCPPGQQNCIQDQQGGNQAGQQNGPHGRQGGPQGQQSGPQQAGPQGGQQGGPQGGRHGPQAGFQDGQQGGPAFKGGPGGQNAGDRNWQDDRGSWHRDHDRYWRSDFRGGFAARDRIFSALRQHQYNRFDGDPYWFNGRYVVRTFDRRGRPVTVEINPYTGEFIGVIHF